MPKFRKKPETITSEQAVEVAKFAGLTFSPADSYVGQDHWVLDDGEDIDLEPHELIDWLYSPESQSALMDKLEELDYWQKHWKVRRKMHEMEKGDHIYELVHDGSLTDLKTGKGKTRQIALINAVLEVIKNEKD